MKLFGIGIFKPKSLKDHVAKFVGGTVRSEGIGKIFLTTPSARFASVPTAERTVTLEFDELTKDAQVLNVQGVVSLVLIPAKVMELHDFTVNANTGAYIDNQVLSNLEANVSKMIQPIVQQKVQVSDIKDHMVNVSVLVEAIRAGVVAKQEAFAELGVEVKQIFIDLVEPEDQEIGDAFRAKVREELLSEADNAVADRRMQNATNERKLRKFEAETAQKMEEERTKLIVTQNENLKATSTAQAEAKKLELAAYEKMDAGKLTALALNQFAATGRVGNLNISPDLFEAITAASSNGNGKAPHRN